MELKMHHEKKKKSSMNNNNPFSILAITLALFVLDLAIILEHFSSSLINILLTFLQLMISDDTALSKSPTEDKGDGIAGPTTTRLSRGEVEMVMERLGISRECGADVDDELDELFRGGLGVGPDEIADVFVEQEPSLDEVKEAFEVFDENGDGVIDAGELSRLLRKVGFAEVGEGDCVRLMRAFDENGDGVIDLGEFTKVVEKSLT